MRACPQRKVSGRRGQDESKLGSFAALVPSLQLPLGSALAQRHPEVLSTQHSVACTQGVCRSRIDAAWWCHQVARVAEGKRNMKVPCAIAGQLGHRMRSWLRVSIRRFPHCFIPESQGRIIPTRCSTRSNANHAQAYPKPGNEVNPLGWISWAPAW